MLAEALPDALSLSRMRVSNLDAKPAASPEPAPTNDRYEPPRFELICLACEISAYAPDSDLPLF